MDSATESMLRTSFLVFHFDSNACGHTNGLVKYQIEFFCERDCRKLTLWSLLLTCSTHPEPPWPSYTAKYTPYHEVNSKWWNWNRGDDCTPPKAIAKRQFKTRCSYQVFQDKYFPHCDLPWNLFCRPKPRFQKLNNDSWILTESP